MIINRSLFMRNTKQKEIILKVLQNDKTHPTIAELYEKVIKADATIGQATVYRNINKLVDDGKAIKVPDLTGIDHYDGDINPHYHLFCNKCKKIIDLYDDKYNDLIKKFERKYSIKIDCSTIMFNGVCVSCNGKI